MTDTKLDLLTQKKDYMDFLININQGTVMDRLEILGKYSTPMSPNTL